MSIVTWIENGKKQFALFDSKYFDKVDQDFPVYESKHSSFRSIVAFSEEEVVLVSGDRKRYRRLKPMSKTAILPKSQKSSSRRKIA